MGRPLIRLAFALLCMASFRVAQAQEPASLDGFGLVFDTAEYSALPLMPLYDGRKGDAAAPRTLSLRPWCPTPLDQGNTGACTGFAAGYGAMTIFEAMRRQTTRPEQIRELACSPWFLYNLVKPPGGVCTEGVRTQQVLDVLQMQGVCLLSDFDTKGNCRILPDEDRQRLAASRKISSYQALFHYPKPLPGLKIAAVRQALAGNMPVIADVQVYESFRKATPGQGYWRKRAADNYLGAHAVVVVGYNDIEQTFELMSSWGAQWADGGFIHLAYEDFAAICLGAYALATEGFRPPEMPHHQPVAVLEPAAAGSQPTASASTNVAPNAEALIYLQGDFELVLADEQGNLIPQPLRYDPATGIYHTLRKTYPVGTSFQLHASDIPPGKHAYVFSCDPSGKVQLHWPKHERMAAFVPGRHVLIAIPSAESTLELARPGDDFLCVLYSEYPIADIRERLARLSGYNAANFQARLEAAFAGILAPHRLVACRPDRMKAQLSGPRKQGTAMGLVLMVRGE
jgi:hypothetical protein